jgi:hypothetical protein
MLYARESPGGAPSKPRDEPPPKSKIWTPGS